MFGRKAKELEEQLAQSEQEVAILAKKVETLSAALEEFKAKESAISGALTNAQRAADIANAYASAAKRFITQTMDTDEPSTFSVALVPSVASSTSITDYVLRGILLGTMAVIGILVLIFLLDNRPKSPEDIMQAANIPTLAVIPSHPELSGDREHRRRRARS